MAGSKAVGGLLLVIGIVGFILSAVADTIGLSLFGGTAGWGIMNTLGCIAGIIIAIIGAGIASKPGVAVEEEEAKKPAEEEEELAEEEAGEVECSACGATISADATECPECGEELERITKEEEEEVAEEKEEEAVEEEEEVVEEYECPTCGASISAEDKVCPECGEEFEEEEVEEEAPPAEEEEEEKAAEEEEEEVEEEFECPECGTTVAADATKCPKCGVEFEE
jgi:ribosomal protein L40E